MAELQRVLRMYHAVKCAKIHEKHGILKYQIACSSSTTQALAQSLETPYEVNTHDLEIEYYFKDVATALAVSGDEEFKKLHRESERFVDHKTAKVTLTWIETYVENGKILNIDSEEESCYAPFAEMADIKESEKPVENYYNS